MKHKMFLMLAALVLLILSASPIWAAEITIDWRQKLDSGQVDDLHFMPGQEQFIISSGLVQKFTEIRSCEDGSIIRSFPFGGYQFEFTPDSTKLIFMSGPSVERGELQLRNLSDMRLITQYQLPKDEELPYSYFDQMAVDPVRPFIYAIWARQNNHPTQGIIKRKILIYDRETLQPAGELTTDVDSTLYITKIAVSNDGKYLAVMTDGDLKAPMYYNESKLIVWSLETRQKIIDTYISDQNLDKSSSPEDIKFSELNTDKIYFTGVFYKENNVGNFGGLCIFSISENKIIDSTFALPPNRYGDAEITLFENETKIIGASGITLKVLDLSGKKIEFEKNIMGDSLIIGNNLNYQIRDKYFIGGGGNSIDRFRYQPNTSVPGDNPKEVIYPNPTTGIVNIPFACLNASKYEIYNSTGRIIISSNLTGVSGKVLTLDFTKYPVGVYSIKVYCGKTVSQYQVVRGE